MRLGLRTGSDLMRMLLNTKMVVIEDERDNNT